MSIENIHDIVKFIRVEYRLTDLDALKIAVEMQRNQIFQAAFHVSSTDIYPAALEAIALQLGYKEPSGQTLLDALNNMAESGGKKYK